MLTPATLAWPTLLTLSTCTEIFQAYNECILFSLGDVVITLHWNRNSGRIDIFMISWLPIHKPDKLLCLFRSFVFFKDDFKCNLICRTLGFSLSNLWQSANFHGHHSLDHLGCCWLVLQVYEKRFSFELISKLFLLDQAYVYTCMCLSSWSQVFPNRAQTNLAVYLNFKFVKFA